MAVEVRIPYLPRRKQKYLHDQCSKHRFSVIVVHRRFGKTVFAINELIRTVMTAKHHAPRVAYIAPTYAMAKRIAWDYAKFYCKPIPGVTMNESELRIDFPNQGRLSLYGAENEDSLRGMYLHKVVLDEYAFMSPRVWTQIIRPALADTKGSAIFTGTPFGDNHFRKIYEYARGNKDRLPLKEGTTHTNYKEWFSCKWGWGDTNIIDADEIEALKDEMDESEFEQEFECSFDVAIRGAYYGKQMEKAEEDGRICTVPYDSDYPVVTAWDIGISDDDATSIWFLQEKFGQTNLIDYEEYYGQSLTESARVLTQDKPYFYSVHVMPHDIATKEMISGKTRLESMQKLGLPILVAPKLGLMEGIDATRKMINRMSFDKVHCEDGIAAMKNYRCGWDIKARVYSPKPKHDWTSHGCDAIRQYAVSEILVKHWTAFANTDLDEIESSIDYSHIT